MQRNSKIARFAVVTALSLVITIFFQGGVVQQEKIIDEPEKESVYEITPKKTSKSAVEKATEEPTEEATEKSTEEITEEVTEPTEAPTEVPTEAPTESETESATMQVVEIASEESMKSLSQDSDSEYVAPTEAPTEWSQELQDLYDAQYEAGYLVAIDNPDYSYYPKFQITLSEEDRILACQIVQGEAGGEGYESCCIVAQCLKDTMISLEYSSIKEVQEKCKYDGWSEEYGEDARKAVEYIFDQNQSAIAHRVMFFYATDLCSSEWHETQNYILTVNKTRYFDMW